MSSSRLLKLFCIVVFCLFGSCFAEKIKTYTYGPEFHPSDVTFTEDGQMVSVTPIFLDDGDKAIYRLAAQPEKQSGKLYFYEGTPGSKANCQRIAFKGNKARQFAAQRSFGVAALPSGLICTNTFTLDGRLLPNTSIGETGPRVILGAAIHCWDGERWVQSKKLNVASSETRRYGNDIDRFGNDLLVDSDGQGILLATSFRAYDIPSTLVLFASNDMTAVKTMTLKPFSVGHFLALRRQDKSIFETTFLLNPKLDRVQGSAIFQLWQGKQKRILDSNSLLSGIVALENTLLVADYYAGELLELSMEGEVLHTFRGLEGPMGMERAPNGDICIAEMLSGRVRCFPLNTLRGH